MITGYSVETIRAAEEALPDLLAITRAGRLVTDSQSRRHARLLESLLA